MSKKKEEEDVDLSAPLAYINAVELLTIARKLSLERKDPNALIDIANSWIEIGHHLLTAEIVLEYDGDSDDETPASDPPQIGFTGGNNDEKESEPGTIPNQNRPGVGF
jgi:hypothetical protein